MFKKKRRRFHRELICPFALDECIERLKRFRYETEQTSFFLDLQLTPMEEGGYSFLITSLKHDNQSKKDASKIQLRGKLESLRGNATRITLTNVNRLGFNKSIPLPAYLMWGIGLAIAVFSITRIFGSGIWGYVGQASILSGIMFLIMMLILWLQGNAHVQEIYHLLFEEELVCRWDV